MAKQTVTLSLDELTKSVGAGLLSVARKPNVYNYIPHDKQTRFHSSQANGRLYVGGNRSGKTVGGIVEDCHYATGRHPYRKVPEPPTYGRIITVDFLKGAEEIIIPQLKQWLPPSELINGSWEDSYSKKFHKLTLANGSEIEIMSHEQDLEAFAGTSRDWLHIDEECPKAIFTESKTRLVDVGGSWWMTMTPVDGMTWVYDDIFMPSMEGGDSSIDVIIVDMADNPYVGEAERLAYLDGLDDEDKKIRGKGEFVALGGLILHQFNYQMHVVDYRLPPYEWEWWVSIDHGIANPTAAMYHAVNPAGNVYTFMEHYKSGMTVRQHADRIKEINEELKKDPEIYVGDPAMRQRNAVTGHSIQIEYGLHNINVAMANNAVDAGLDKMNEYLRQGRWIISERCPNLLKEIRKYRRKKYASPKLADQNNRREEPRKKDDHAIDSCRYLFSFMPDLKPMPHVELVRISEANKAAREVLFPGTTFDVTRKTVYPWQIDPHVTRPSSPERSWGEV
jgi:phage terminase large subunit-like protein